MENAIVVSTMNIQIKNKTILIDEEDYPFFLSKRWYISGNGYVMTADGSAKYFHRLLLKLSNSISYVDHINHNLLDNRKCNLRICSKQQNNFNMKLSSHNTSGYKGVTWQKQNLNWVSQIHFNNKRIFLFSSFLKEECAYAYDYAAKLVAKEFAYLNNVIISDEKRKLDIERKVEYQLKKHKLLCKKED